MHDEEVNRRLIVEIADSLDIPESAYEKAEKRYKDLGEWFSRPEARCSAHAPNVYPQGSFRLGTVVRPLDESAEYDLDMGCRLDDGITKETHTQGAVKRLVGQDLEEYRKARGIEAPLDEKHRCWRLSYADELRFHIDAVPSIPENQKVRGILREAMVKYGSSEFLAERVTKLAGAITDKRSPDYDRISSDWRVSNSKGYALWFEDRMKQAPQLLEKRASTRGYASIDEMPAAEWKSPLQRSIQILKRHRDVMYADDPDSAPISIIITTLAASAYRGEADVAVALRRILSDMDSYVRASEPRVPNPVNPEEDFADKWHAPEYQHLHLEENFKVWLKQAREDFRSLGSSVDPVFLAEQVRRKIGVTFGPEALRGKLGLGSVNVVTTPKTKVIAEAPARPWEER